MARKRKGGRPQGAPRNQQRAAATPPPATGVKRALEGLRGGAAPAQGQGTHPSPRPLRSAGRAKPVAPRQLPTARRDGGRPARSPAPRRGPERDRPDNALSWMLGRRGSARSRGARGAGSVEQPPVASSIARGMAMVGSSPTLLITAFVFLLVLWLAFTTYGVVLAAAPAAMVLLEALPPVHSFVDIQFLVAGRVVAPAVALAFAAGLLVLRSLAGSFWIAVMLERFDAGDGQEPSLAGALRRVRSSFLSVLGVEAAYFVVALIALIVASGVLGSLGQLAVIGALIGGLYFLVYAEIAVLAEGANPREAFRLSIEAARIPGPRHMLLIVSYITFTLFISVVTPSSRVAAATPTLWVWLLTLFVGFVHVSVLCAFVYRWLLLRLNAKAGLEGRRSRPSRTS